MSGNKQPQLATNVALRHLNQKMPFTSYRFILISPPSLIMSGFPNPFQTNLLPQKQNTSLEHLHFRLGRHLVMIGGSKKISAATFRMTTALTPFSSERKQNGSRRSSLFEWTTAKSQWWFGSRMDDYWRALQQKVRTNFLGSLVLCTAGVITWPVSAWQCTSR